jgi:hypothetical protein
MERREMMMTTIIIKVKSINGEILSEMEREKFRVGWRIGNCRGWWSVLWCKDCEFAELFLKFI